jgi:hypothetical protein
MWHKLNCVVGSLLVGLYMLISWHTWLPSCTISRGIKHHTLMLRYYEGCFSRITAVWCQLQLYLLPEARVFYVQSNINGRKCLCVCYLINKLLFWYYNRHLHWWKLRRHEQTLCAWNVNLYGCIMIFVSKVISEYLLKAL